MEYLLNIWFGIEVVFGIGFLIFVHELGHFLFAKRHGVRVDTFSLGFGKRIWGFKRGGTDYRISMIPLGGYVKMAGENPDDARTGSPDELGSKGVWARFQIFIAGIASNFAWSFPIMILAFLVGKESAAPFVGDVRPDSSEWASDLNVGDELVSIGGSPIRGYEDYVKEIVRRPKGDKLEVEYRRGGELRKTTVTVGTAKQIGMSPVSTVIAEVMKGKAAEAAGFREKDEILAIDGIAVFEAGEIAGLIDRSEGKALQVTVRGADGQTRVISVTPAKGEERMTLGIGPETTPTAIGVVRPGSPADKAGLQPGDVITSVGGQPTPDFPSMTALIRPRAGQAVDLGWTRGGEAKTGTITVGSQGGRGFIGVMPQPSTVLATVLADTPLGKAGVKSGDRILTVNGKEVRAQLTWTPEDIKASQNGDLFLGLGQVEGLARTKGEPMSLGIKRGGESLTLEVKPEKRGDGDLGIKLQHKTVMVKPGLGGAIKRGSAEVMDVFILTWQMLRKLLVHEEEASNLSGPVGIMTQSYKSAKEGFGNLLWLMGLISVNLAVINLLPIPVLDGGHIMFLIIEKVRGKPVNERIMAIATWIGLILLLSLVVFVTVHDIVRLRQ